MEEKYKPSGIAPLNGMVKAFIFGLITAILFPLFYIILGKIVSNIWFSCILAFVFGGALALSINLGLKWGKVRNIRVGALIATCCGLMAWYLQWALFDAIMYSEKGFTFSLTFDDLKILFLDAWRLFNHPKILFQEIINLNRVGTFRIEGNDGPITGIVLWVIWAVEFLIIVVTSILMSSIYGAPAQPFSEQNNAWMERRKPVKWIRFIEDKEGFLNHLKNKNYKELNEEPDFSTEENYAELVIFESPGDPIKVINVINVFKTKKKWSKEKIERKAVVKNYLLQNAAI